MISSLGMCCIFSGGFFFPLRMERRGRQNDAETFHHFFLLLIQHSFYRSPSSKKILMPVYSSRTKNVLLCLHDHTFMWVGPSRTRTCQSIGGKKLPFPSFPTSGSSETYFTQWEGQVCHRAMNIYTFEDFLNFWF